MNISIFEAEIEDLSEIDEFLSEHESASPYHSLRWLIAIQQAYKFGYSYLLARSERNILGVLPLCRFINLTGSKEFCSLPYCDVGGVIAVSPEIENILFSYAKDMMIKENLHGLEIRNRAKVPHDGNEMTERKVSMMLTLPESPDLLLKSFKSKLRSQIKKAEKNGLSFDYGNDCKSIDDFYYVYSRNMLALGSPSHDKQWFYELVNSYQDNILVGRVWNNNQIVGAGILLFSGENVSIPWASTLRNYNHLAPNMLLYWNLLKISCERGCKVFDFGRSTYGEGTFKFKQQWGASPILLDWQNVDKNAELIEPKNAGNGKVRKLIEDIWMKLPLTIANYIGPKLRRHISL